MTLTVVVGSSGSGKTTFLNDVHKAHKCTYIRQYHNIRPYVTVTKIPNFDPTTLPFWDTYVKEGTASTIKAGGTMAGEFTAGLSGGQRKLLLFEIVYQRTKDQSDLLICLDEPFAGVTDNFVPFIVQRLDEMRRNHNILLVTNDHVDTLKSLADNTITVSAIDRSNVQINGKDKVDREKAIIALSVGDNYVYKATWADFKFFIDVEVISNGGLMVVAAFTIFYYALFLLTFWGSAIESDALVVLAGGFIAFFCLNPYLLTLTDWRIFMHEEAQALLHASKGMNNFLKTLLALALLFIVSIIQYVTTIAVIDGLNDISFWVAMLLDSASLTFPYMIFGIYTTSPFQTVDMLANLPFLLMIFLSTTFSPGSGIPILKELRYLFPRFYFWCILPGTKDGMENCPNTDAKNMVYLFLTSMITLVMFLVVKGMIALVRTQKKKKVVEKMKSMKDDEFRQLQIELYGEDRVFELDRKNDRA